MDAPDSLRDSDPGPLRFRGTHRHEFWATDRECGDTEDTPETEEAAESTIDETVQKGERCLRQFSDTHDLTVKVGQGEMRGIERTTLPWDQAIVVGNVSRRR